MSTPVPLLFFLCSRAPARLRAKPFLGAARRAAKNARMIRQMTDQFLPTVLCSVADAARSLGIGKTKAYDLISRGQLDTVSIGTRRLVKVASIHQLVEAAAASKAA